MQSITDDLRNKLTNAIGNDELVLPTMPEVALQVKQEAEDDLATAASISRVIGSDAAMSARIIKVANSPLLRGIKTVDDLQMAISRMGLAYACNLAIGIAMEQLFQATSEVVDKLMRDSWTHSTEVASISHVLCQHFTKLRPDQATLAGLVHAIGVLPILTYADDQDEWSEQVLTQVIDELHPEMGSRILEAWDFPEELLDVPRQYLNFSRDNASTDYGDVVLVANLQSRSGTSHPLTQMDWSAVTAFDHLGLDPDVIWSEQEELSEDLAAARDLLH
jgi:HD-like signal output (HDOD) protein|tara:strand:- start:16233 stop:17063 length:831 start_codon:yes stop_codon:yes gene_type:complete